MKKTAHQKILLTLMGISFAILIYILISCVLELHHKGII